VPSHELCKEGKKTKAAKGCQNKACTATAG
jgi:hypothetical protein